MKKPRIIILVDRYNWAFDFIARSIKARLKTKFDIKVICNREKPNLDSTPYDLIYQMMWSDRCFRNFKIDPERLLIEIANPEWVALQPNISVRSFVDKFLSDCGYVSTPCRTLQDNLKPFVKNTYLIPNGFEPALFNHSSPKKGPLTIAWVGNPNNEIKGLKEILIPACEGRFKILWPDGSWTRSKVSRLYQQADIIAIASKYESQPLPLIEGMASGCFPVATDVGIVSSLIQSGYNGLIVERSVDAFRNAFIWCDENLDIIRERRSYNAQLMLLNRSWDICARYFEFLFQLIINRNEGKDTASLERQLNAVHESPEIQPSSREFVLPVRHRFSKRYWSLYDRWHNCLDLKRRINHVGMWQFLSSRILNPSWFIGKFRSERMSGNVEDSKS